MNIKGFRKDNNLSQTELADKLGVTMRTVRNWEKGEPPKIVELALKELERKIDTTH